MCTCTLAVTLQCYCKYTNFYIAKYSVSCTVTLPLPLICTTCVLRPFVLKSYAFHHFCVTPQLIININDLSYDMDEDVREQQENECLALQSILGENDFQFTLPNGTMKICPNQTLLHISVESSHSDDASNKPNESYLVKYLPPFTLTFTLSENYPSDQCPFFILTCSWLARSQVRILIFNYDSVNFRLSGLCHCLFSGLSGMKCISQTLISSDITRVLTHAFFYPFPDRLLLICKYAKFCFF